MKATFCAATVLLLSLAASSSAGPSLSRPGQAPRRGRRGRRTSTTPIATIGETGLAEYGEQGPVGATAEQPTAAILEVATPVQSLTSNPVTPQVIADTPIVAEAPGAPQATQPGSPVAGDEPAATVDMASPPAAGTAPEGSAGEGDLRIVDRVEVNGYVTGALQVFIGGAYGAVCTVAFDPVDADVACRQMGFIGGTSIPTAIDRTGSDLEQFSQFESVLAPMVLENLNCTGAEARLVDCPGIMIETETVYSDYNLADIQASFTYYGGGEPVCDPLLGTFAYVACGTQAGPADGDLRLVGGASESPGTASAAEYGRLQIFSSGGWGVVCDDELQQDYSGFANVVDARFTEAAVGVACRQLGFTSGEKVILAQDLRPVETRRVPIALPGADCTGSESSLQDCPGVDLMEPVTSCGLRDSVAITCFNAIDPAVEGSLRLMDGQMGANFEYGRVEINLKGFWNSICDTMSFTPDAAQVACSILGYDGGTALQFKQALDTQGVRLPSGFLNLPNQVLVADLPVSLASVDCDGDETSLLQCTSNGEDLRGCTVPDTNFTDATVLACANTAAGCDMQPTPEEGAVRLRGGFGTLCDPIHTGFVEVFHLGEWGAICTNIRFQSEERLAGDVVCRQLGFPHGTTVDPSSNPLPPVDDGYYSSYDPDVEEATEAQERFWLNQVTCRGPEERLVDCDIGQGFRPRNAGCPALAQRLTVACRTFAVSEALEDVTTPGAVEGDLRLVERSAVSNWQMGRLEVFFEGSWSQVCSTGFGSADADVACRQLGLGAGTIASNLVPSESVSDTLVHPEVAVTLSGCIGTEERLLDCEGEDARMAYEYLPGCDSDSEPGLVLACVDTSASMIDTNVAEGDIRLTDGGSSNGDGEQAGVLEIFHAGAWGTVCSAISGQESQNTRSRMEVSVATASVACRELGFARGFSREVQGTPSTPATLPPWLTADVRCTQTEERLSECTPLEYGATASCGGTTRLICLGGEGDGSARGEARLVGGAVAAAGGWEYGRVQVSDGTFFRSVLDRNSFPNLGRRGAQVACRSLGFDSGAKLLSGTRSGLPGNDNALATSERFLCTGREETMDDCSMEVDIFREYDDDVPGLSAVAVICASGSGCAPEDTPPVQGDIRLVNFQGVNSTTSPCDDIHFGGVQFFNEGQWGLICGAPRFSLAEPTVDANVICRQLGFPFGGLMDSRKARSNSGVDFEEDDPDYDIPGSDVVWATEVQCTGTESRLDECFFPENFGGFTRSVSFPIPSRDGAVGVLGEICSARDFLGVVCRRFEIAESEVIQ